MAPFTMPRTPFADMFLGRFGATLSVWHMNREVDNIFARKDQKQQMEVLALDERFGGFDSNTELTAYR